MNQKIVANRFGLILMLLSLFASTAALAVTQPVLVTNSSAQPVPVIAQAPQYYQAMQSVNCSNMTNVSFAFNTGGKKLLVRSVNVYGYSTTATDTFGMEIYPDDASTSYLFLPMQATGGYSAGFYPWVTNQQVQAVANQAVSGTIRRSSSSGFCAAIITISGELIN
jgi:hypothetical protein